VNKVPQAHTRSVSVAVSYPYIADFRHSLADCPTLTSFLPLGSGITTVPLTNLLIRVVLVSIKRGFPATRYVALVIKTNTSKGIASLTVAGLKVDQLLNFRTTLDDLHV
jgi:hypothetical protein